MKSIRHALSLGALALSFLTTTALLAADSRKKDHEQTKGSAPAGSSGTLAKAAEKDAAWVAQERKKYPLTACLTSDEKLGNAGDNAEYIYREKGKPDRLVIFCCDGCEDDFKKEPAKYLAKLDAAAKQKKKS